MDDENKTPTNVSAKLDEQRFVEAVEQNATRAANDANDSIAPASYNHHSPAVELNMVIDDLQSVDIAESAHDDKGESTKDSGADRNPLVKKEKSSGAAAAPIIVPIVLKMAEFDHKALLEEWISTRSFSDNYPLQDKDKLISNLKTIQDYLCSFTSQGLTVANISATTFPQTLDWLHSYLLQCIEQGGTSSVSSGTVKVTPQKQSTG